MTFLQKPPTRILAERKREPSMRTRFIVGSAMLLAACGEPLKPPPDAERVHIVLYHPLQSSYAMKTVGDWAMLSTGELVQIESSTWLAAVGLGRPALPVPPQLIEPNPRKWEQSIEKRVKQGNVEMLLDRRRGSLCFNASCVRVLSICPPTEALMKQGAKCQGFSNN